MATTIFLAFIILVSLLAYVLVLLVKMKPKAEDTVGMQLLMQQLNDLRNTVDQKMGDTSKMMSESMRNQFADSERLIKSVELTARTLITDVTDRFAKLEETNRSVVSIGTELQALSDILKNPKQRGILGEYFLEHVLKNVMPPDAYTMQYQFQDGEIVDAVIYIKDKIVPIDSKFSLENYNRLVQEKDPIQKEKYEKEFVNDLKKRIQETSKYVRPAEGTLDFAFMFIPHEAIYYDLLINRVGVLTEEGENLIQRAASKHHVIIVSPTSFLAYLQTVLQGLKAMQIEEQAKDIIIRVGELGQHLKKYEEYHGKLGASLGTVVNHFNVSGKELKKIDKDIMKISGAAPGIQEHAVDKPELDQM